MEGPTATGGLSKSRQKSCNGCVQARRRCDRRTPACSRCAEKKTACIYGKTKVASQHAREEFGPPSPPTGRRAFGSPACAPFAPGESPDVNYLGIMPTDSQFGVATAPTESMQDYVMDTTIDGDISMDPFIDLMGDSITPTQGQWLVQIEQGPVTERPSSPADEEIIRSYQKMAEFCGHMAPWHLYDPKASLHYIVNRVKGFVTDVATRNATPFLHRYLYRDHTPHCILSCFAANVLYANRTRANTAMVMLTLHRSVRELVDAEAGRIVATPVEKLARTQALFLYQVIRLLDGNVILRAQGERDIPLLLTWLGDLCKVRENLGDLAQLGDSAMRGRPPGEWEPHFIIKNYSFEHFLEYGRGDDLDEFAEILLTVYMGVDAGDAEDIIGKWLALNPEKRKDIFLATKFGGIQLPTGFSFRGDAAYVPIACEQSLNRLRVDAIDLWYPHRLDGSTPVEHIVAEMVKLKEQGKIRHIGLSEVSSATLRRAFAVHPIACVQMEYSVFSTEIESPEHNLLATCRELGVAVVAYSPLSRGLLGEDIQGPDDFGEGDIRRFYPRFSRENFPKNMELVGAIKELATKKGVTVGQVALAWLLSQGDDIFPIPGTITYKYIEENFEAMHVELTPEESQHIRDLVVKASVFGERWPVEHQFALFADTPLPEDWKEEKKELTVLGQFIVNRK
ncbi:hypothetical protein DL765_005445 [Monosporascus sp. GIB2]|nr:hypothetical protein DL765_005445 [Monosporascus sp. GIB2]